MSSLKNTALLSLFFLNSWIGIELPVLCFSVPFPAYRKFHFRSTGPSPPPPTAGNLLKRHSHRLCALTKRNVSVGVARAARILAAPWLLLFLLKYSKTCYIPSLLKRKKIFHRFSTILIKHF